MEAEIPVRKDAENELPVPTVWREVIREIVLSFVNGDYRLSSGISGVTDITKETSEQIESNIRDYGEELVPLPDESWESSIYLWMGTHWQVIVDLWTAGEGRSDMVLSAHVNEREDRFIYSIYMVQVP